MSGIDGGESLAEERTTLAWSRSSLALLACGAAVLKGVPNLDYPRGRTLAGAFIVTLAAIAAVVGSLEERARRRAVARGVGAIDEGVVRRMAYAHTAIGAGALLLAAISG